MSAQDPGAPRTDKTARDAALNAIAAHVEQEEPEAQGDYCATRLLDDLITSVTWERDVNANGVPVRRYVLRGAWEVDPEGRAGAALRSRAEAITRPMHEAAEQFRQTAERQGARDD